MASQDDGVLNVGASGNDEKSALSTPRMGKTPESSSFSVVAGTVRRRTSFSSTLGRSTRPSTLQRQALASRASAISLVPNWPRTSYLNDPRQLLPVLMTPDHPLYAFGICCTPDELDRWPVEVGWELRTQLWSRAKGNRILSGGIRHTLEPGRRTAPGNR
jgi:hypothetical protein